jgi:hypothetical protein
MIMWADAEAKSAAAATMVDRKDMMIVGTTMLWSWSDIVTMNVKRAERS